ncbi:MAG: DUF7455 domain-containing protein [Pseudoclavibacter sp.]
MIETTTAPASATTPLTAFDRCDACGAQAYVRVQLEHGEFLFCGHHASKHAEKLRPTAVHWHDETSKLYAADARTAPVGADS